MRLAKPKNKNQQLDWEAWTPSTQIGEVMDDPLNPVLYEQRLNVACRSDAELTAESPLRAALAQPRRQIRDPRIAIANRHLPRLLDERLVVRRGHHRHGQQPHVGVLILGQQQQPRPRVDVWFREHAIDQLQTDVQVIGEVLFDQ